MSERLEVPPPEEPGVARVSTRTAAILTLFTVAFTALMALTYQASRPAIEASARAERMRLIGEVLPRGEYDNDLLQDAITVPAEPALGLDAPASIHRARKGGQAVALVVEAAAPDGYSGRIKLLLAVRADGSLAAVRVTEHRETPGLGDYIDPRKDRDKTHPWIGQFDGQDFAKTPPERWKVRKDGGVFDQMSGATISARAVTNATRKALEWVNDHREQLFALQAGGSL